MRAIKLLLALSLATCQPAYADRILSGDIVEGIVTQKNYLKEKGHFEKNAAGWVGYDDAAATPVDGTGGTVATTCTRTTTTPLSGSGSFLYTPAALGEGCAASFTIDSKDQGRVLQLSFDYSIVSGTYTDDDTTIWIVETGTPTAIQPAPYKLKKTGITEKFAVEFQTLSTATSYRVLIHQATSGTAVLKFDNFQVGPQAKLYGSPVTDFVSFTPTGGWTGVTYTGNWRRVGDSMEVMVGISMTGAPTGTLTVNLPTGYTIDTAKIPLTGSDQTQLGTTSVLDTSDSWYLAGHVGYSSTTSVRAFASTSATSNGKSQQITATTPVTFATGDRVQLRFTVPIVGWSSSQIMSSDANTSIVAARYSTNVAQSVANSGDTLIDFEDKEFDTCGCVTTGASWKFTAPSPGYYKISASNVFAASVYAAGNQYYGTVFKNGSAHSYFGLDSIESTTSQSVSANGTVLIQLVAGDYIDVRLFNNRTAGATALNGTTGANYISVEKLSGQAQVMAADSVSALYTGAPPTGTLTNSYNTTTFGTKVKDTHSAFNGTSYTVPVSGTYSIAAATAQAATYVAGKIAITAIFVDGVQAETNIVSAGGANLYLYPQVVSHSRPLLAGQVVTIRSYNDATTPTFGNQATQNYFSIVRTGNY